MGTVFLIEVHRGAIVFGLVDVADIGPLESQRHIISIMQAASESGNDTYVEVPAISIARKAPRAEPVDFVAASGLPSAQVQLVIYESSRTQSSCGS